MKNKLLRIMVIILIGAMFPWFQPNLTTKANITLKPIYVFPIPDLQRLNPQTSIIIRYAQLADADHINFQTFVVKGEVSGLHTGNAVVSDDHTTVTFTPAQPFTPGEKVNVTVTPTWIDLNQPAFLFSFSVEKHPQEPQAADVLSNYTSSEISYRSPAISQASAFPDYLTLPYNYPDYTITGSTPGSNSGDYFLAPFSFNNRNNYMLTWMAQVNLSIITTAVPNLSTSRNNQMVCFLSTICLYPVFAF